MCFFRLLIIGLLTLSQNVFAVAVEDLFEVEVIAKSQSREDRNTAIKEAMTIVLGRVMAGENIFQDPVVQSALADAPRYVRQYQYALVPMAAGAADSSRLMRVLFDETALLGLMKASKLGIWNEIRPEMLVWLVVEQRGRRRLYRQGLYPEMDKALFAAAKRKGLPLLLPLMDLQDQQAITVKAVLSAHSEQLLKASERYDTPAVLAGRVVRRKGCWLADWRLYFDQKINQWSSPCCTLFEVMLSGMQGAYDKLSAFYAVKVGVLEQGEVTLKIMGIKGIDDMTLLTDYLEGLSGIKAVSWLRVEAGGNYFAVEYLGDRQEILDMLALGRVLEPLNAGEQGADVIEYRLLPKSQSW